jgi:hypothetical protein
MNNAAFDLGIELFSHEVITSDLPHDIEEMHILYSRLKWAWENCADPEISSSIRQKMDVIEEVFRAAEELF